MKIIVMFNCEMFSIFIDVSHTCRFRTLSLKNIDCCFSPQSRKPKPRDAGGSWQWRNRIRYFICGWAARGLTRRLKDLVYETIFFHFGTLNILVDYVSISLNCGACLFIGRLLNKDSNLIRKAWIFMCIWFDLWCYWCLIHMARNLKGPYFESWQTKEGERERERVFHPKSQPTYIWWRRLNWLS